MQSDLDHDPAAAALPAGAMFHPAVSGWLRARFGQATEVQTRAWAVTSQRRHALIAAGEQRPQTGEDTLRAIAARFSCDTQGFADVLDVREHRKRQSEVRLRDVVRSYLNTVEHVSASVDRMLDSAGARP